MNSPNLRDTLNEVKKQNLRRFEKKLPKDAKATEVLKNSDGGATFRADVPARNIPESFARYEKIIDRAGNTISYTKTTYAPNGKIIHIKIK